MKALVLSDSHGSFQSIMNAVESEKDISLIIFAGDIQRDADDIAAAYPDIPFEYVLGNNDCTLTTFLMTDCLSFPANVFF